MSDESAGWFADAEAARARIADQVAQAQQHAAQMKALAGKLRGLQAELWSPRRDVWVRVDSAGSLQDLRIETDALRLSAASLASTILETYREAQRQLARQAVEVTRTDGGDALANQVRSDYESRLGSLDDDQPEDRIATPWGRG